VRFATCFIGCGMWSWHAVCLPKKHTFVTRCNMVRFECTELTAVHVRRIQVFIIANAQSLSLHFCAFTFSICFGHIQAILMLNVCVFVTFQHLQISVCMCLHWQLKSLHMIARPFSAMASSFESLWDFGFDAVVHEESTIMLELDTQQSQTEAQVVAVSDSQPVHAASAACLTIDLQALPATSQQLLQFPNWTSSIDIMGVHDPQNSGGSASSSYVSAAPRLPAVAVPCTPPRSRRVDDSEVGEVSPFKMCRVSKFGDDAAHVPNPHRMSVNSCGGNANITTKIDVLLPVSQVPPDVSPVADLSAAADWSTWMEWCASTSDDIPVSAVGTVVTIDTTSTVVDKVVTPGVISVDALRRLRT